MQVQKILKKLLNYESLNYNECYEVFEKFLTKNSPSSQIAGFLIALRMKGENSEELFALSKCMKDYSKKLDIKNHKEIIDICGTGGDYSNTINISTIASFILSACGVCVAKHSSKKMTSTCGSADLLSKAGYNLNTPFEIVKKSIEEEGIGFLYAPLYHPMARRVAKIRAQLGVITTFNIIGALANPVNITHRLMGVNEKRILKPVSEAIREIGIKKGLVLISNDGLDEISIFDKTYGILIENEKLKEIEIYPEDFGIKREKNIESIKVKGKTNALKMMLDILECKIPIDSPPIKIVLANVSAALYVMNRVNDFKEGYEFAKETLLSKKALEKFKSWLKISNS
ncbi:MAG: anthranilate phosphoribosyltransferase [candidate division WOR-3 bacterium]